MNVDAFYICPWSLRDPLCQSQCLAYIRGLVGEGYSFALLTLEKDKFAIPTDEQARVGMELAAENIYWYPVEWNSGNAITDKFTGIWSVIAAGTKISRKHQPRMIHSRSSLPAFMAVVLAKMFRLKFLYDADSVLSEEYADTGHLSRASPGFKFLAWSESRARKSAAQIIVLTAALEADLLDKYGVEDPVSVIPCCVDTDLFRPNEASRDARRAELGITSEKLFVYVGKAGSWYLVEDTFKFYKVFKELRPASKLLIVTQDDPAVFHKIAAQQSVASNDYFVRRAERREVRDWLSASDAGFSLIRQVASKRGSSPVKFAEYLSTGLPVISTDGIGDCTKIILENNAGVVMKNLGEDEMRLAAEALLKLLEEDRDAIARRCRTTAEQHFSLKDVGHPRYREIYKRLLSSEK